MSNNIIMNKLKGGSKAKTKQPKFLYLVSWDRENGTDPVKYFATKVEAEEFIQAMVDDNWEDNDGYDVNKNSVRLVEIKKTHEVVGTGFVLREMTK